MLSDAQIKSAIMDGQIIVSPLNGDNIGPNSIDVTLGEYIWTPDDSYMLRHSYYDPFDEDDVRDYWTNLKFYAGAKFSVPPGMTILAHTQEIIGTVAGSSIVAKMQARSSVGRSGIIVCACAGSGDVGYVNRWTMEIRNTLTVPILLWVGMRIAQITFDHTGYVERPYTGKYGQGEWTPEDMLPKLWKDREVVQTSK